MKKHLHTLLFILCLPSLILRAQVITNTYTTGFDDASGQAGWTEYRQGDLGAYEFNLGQDVSYSPLNCIYHNYPVNGSQETIDWMVSPVFDFSAGGTIDSLRAAFGGFGTPASADTVAIFLLQGSANPSLATNKLLLFDFRGANYTNDNTWRKFSNIAIPATTGTCYIGFKYKTIINWLDVKFDNLSVRSSHHATATGLLNSGVTSTAITLFPNPVTKNTYLHITATGKEKVTLKLFNILGAEVLEKNISDEQRVLIEQPAGYYIYQLRDGDGRVVKSGKVLVQ